MDKFPTRELHMTRILILFCFGMLAPAFADTVCRDASRLPAEDCASNQSDALIETRAEDNSELRDDRYAAIAYSFDGTGRYGIAWNFRTLREAQTASLRMCGYPRCRAEVWTKNGCAALAVVVNDLRQAAYSWDSNRWEAEARSLNLCESIGLGACKIQAWVCNG